MDSKIKIATININKLKSEEKRRRLFKFCQINKLDVICFQEMNFKSCHYFETEYLLITNIGPNGSGVGIALKKDLKHSQILKDGEGRILKCEIEGINLINIYAPSGREKRDDRNVFFSMKIVPYFSNTTGPTILLGDFNSVEHQDDVNIKKHRRNSKIVNKQIKELIQALKMRDIWVSRGGSRKEHTFFYPKGSSRIDRIYIEQKHEQIIEAVNYQATDLTDHLAVVIHTSCSKINPTRKQNNIWKMNSKILTEPMFVKAFEEWWVEINRFKIKKNKIRDWWDKIFKTGLKRIAIQCSKTMAKNFKEKRVNDQILMEDIIEKINGGEDLWEELRTTKKSIKEWEKEIASRNLIKNKQGDKMEGEECTSHHIKHNQITTTINKLEINGEITDDEFKIKTEFENHFKNIFQKKGYEYKENKFIEIIETKELESKISNPIKESEIKFVLDRCKKEKSPGHDGIPYEFYQKFWNVLNIRMTELFNEIIDSEELAESQSLATVKLIPKVVRPIRLSDFRPISLLCTDYKILSGVLAERMKPLLPEVIHESQKGGVPGRSLFNSLSLFRDITARIGELNKDIYRNDWRKPTKVNAAFIAIDFEKAYDLVQREFLWEIMYKMGFDVKFVNILKGLYKSCKLKVIDGGNKIIEIEGKNSIRQGCPLSMHLFTIFIEPLIRFIDAKIEGFKHGKKRAAARAFVDDLNVIVTCESEILKLSDILNDFCTESGAKFNKSKTCIMGLGGWEGRSNWPINEIQPTQSMKILGITFHPNLKKTINENWTEKLKKLKGQLIKNANRRLTLHQRNKFIKEFILPQALHLAKILKCPEEIAEKIKRSMQRFIWYGKLERPTPGVQIAPEKEGGIAFIHPGNFFLAALTKTVIDVLEKDKGLENELLTYWMYLNIKNATRSTRTNAPKSFKVPDHLKEPATQINEWNRRTKEKISSKITTKDLYLQWANANKAKSKLEIRRPKLMNWKRAWKTYHKMEPPEKEILFMLNHDILPNMVRLSRMKMTSIPLCQYCKKAKETNVHMFLKCPKKKEAVKQLQSIKQPEKAIRGDVTGAKQRKLIGKYLKNMWKSRKKNKIPKWAKGGKEPVILCNM